MPLTILSLVIVLGVLISVHEFGHFIVAKAVGIQVLRFSLGFGRPLISWRRGETEYWISWIPLGGYVKMAGLEDEGMAGELEGGASAEPIDPARAFDKKPVAVRLMVVCAGVAMNAASVSGTRPPAPAGAPPRRRRARPRASRHRPPGARPVRARSSRRSGRSGSSPRETALPPPRWPR